MSYSEGRLACHRSLFGLFLSQSILDVKQQVKNTKKCTRLFYCVFLCRDLPHIYSETEFGWRNISHFQGSGYVFSQFENQKLKPAAYWCAHPVRELWIFREMTSVWSRCLLGEKWGWCCEAHIREYNKIKTGLSPHVSLFCRHVPVVKPPANSFCTLKRPVVFSVFQIIKRSWHPVSIWIHNRSQRMLPRIMYANSISTGFRILALILLDVEMKSGENQPILEEGSERCWEGKWWELSGELVISLSRKARKLKSGNSNNKLACRSVVEKRHTVYTVYIEYIYRHMAKGQLTANKRYEWEQLLKKWHYHEVNGKEEPRPW